VLARLFTGQAVCARTSVCCAARPITAVMSPCSAGSGRAAAWRRSAT